MNQDITTRFNISGEEYRAHLELVTTLAPKLVGQNLEISRSSGDLDNFLWSLGKVRIKDSRPAISLLLHEAQPDLVDLVVPVAQSASEIVVSEGHIGEKLADVLELAQIFREVPYSEFDIGESSVSALDLADDMEKSVMNVIKHKEVYLLPEAVQPLIRVLPNPDSESFRPDVHTEQFVEVSKIFSEKLDDFFKVFHPHGYSVDMADDMHDLLRHFANNAAEEQYLNRTAQLFDILSIKRQGEVFIDEATTFHGNIIDHPILSRFVKTEEGLGVLVDAARGVHSGGFGLPERIRHLDV